MDRKQRIANFKTFVEAINRGDGKACAPLLTEDFVHVDCIGQAIDGREAVLGAIDRARDVCEFCSIEIDWLGYRFDSCLVKGRTQSDMARFSGTVLWRIMFEGDRLREMHSFRPQALNISYLLHGAFA